MKLPLSLLLAALLGALALSGCGDRGSDLVATPPPPPLPAISSVTPESAAVGDTVRVSGLHFGSSAAQGVVEFSGPPPGVVVAQTVLSWSDTLVVVVVPPATVSGTVRVRVNGTGSNEQGFIIRGAPAVPVLLGLVPNRTVAGDTVRVAGSNLGGSQGASVVLFAAPGGGADTASVVSWSADTVLVLVPAGAADGSVLVSVGGHASNGLLFSVAPARVHYADIDGLLQSDGCYGCHFGGGPFVGNFDVSSYAAVMSGSSDHGPVVTPRHGDDSVIVKKLLGTAGFGVRMPQGGNQVPAAEIQKFVDWIDQGAFDN